jgi:hypothetical protein
VILQGVRITPFASEGRAGHLDIIIRLKLLYANI